ncbi:MAG: hypothetical protein AAGG50_15265 [Bacteroidota bacterium]
MQPPPFVPTYNKPDAPGVHLSFDNTVALYQVVAEDDTFGAAAQEAFALLRTAQDRFPDWPRVYYLDVHGHEGEAKGFNPDFFEFQQDFLLGTLGPFFTALVLPLTGGLVNPEVQRNDVPDELRIGGEPGAEEADAG